MKTTVGPMAHLSPVGSFHLLSLAGFCPYLDLATAALSSGKGLPKKRDCVDLQSLPSPQASALHGHVLPACVLACQVYLETMQSILSSPFRSCPHAHLFQPCVLTVTSSSAWHPRFVILPHKALNLVGETPGPGALPSSECCSNPILLEPNSF